MSIDLLEKLPSILPKAIEWASDQAEKIQANGVRLDANLIEIARAVGVTSPEMVRVLEVDAIEPPQDPGLYKVAMATGLFGPGIKGMTLGTGIFICRGHFTNRLLSHELRHVQQYEKAGSIKAFLDIYLHQIATVGYELAPLEIDARAHEVS